MPKKKKPVSRPAKPLTPKIVKERAFRVAGLQGRFTPKTTKKIPALWDEFVPHIPKLTTKPNAGAFGILRDMFEDGEAFYYLCAVATPKGKEVEGFTYLDIPAQSYAVFEHNGHVSKFSETVGRIFNEWLPDSDYGLNRPTPEAPDFLERYTKDFDPVKGLGGMEIWIPVKA